MDPNEFSDPIIIPITLTIPYPFPRRPTGRFDHGPTRHPSFTDPDWFARQGVFGRRPASPSQEGGEASRADATARFLTVEEFKRMGAEARAANARAERLSPLSTKIVHQDTQVAALGPYTGPPLPPEVKAAFDGLARMAQGLANDFYLNHPEMVDAPPTVIGTVLHDDFAKAVKAMNDPRFRVEYSRVNGQQAKRGQLGSVRTDIEYIDPDTKAVLAVLDYKTTSDPDFTPGDWLTIPPRRAEQIRQAPTEMGAPIDPSVRIIGMRVPIPPM